MQSTSKSFKILAHRFRDHKNMLVFKIILLQMFLWKKKVETSRRVCEILAKVILRFKYY